MKLFIVAAALACLAIAVQASISTDAIDTDAIISKVNSQNGGWTAGVNQRFANLTKTEVRRMMGVLPGKRPFVPRLAAPEVAADSVPTDFDARTASNWAKCSSIISQIRDQSACGSCWAFGGASAMSDRLCIATGGSVAVPLSTEDLVSCCDSCGDGCNGGYPESAWMYFQETGLVAEAQYPYAFPSCEHHTTGSKPACGAEQPTPACDNSKLKGKRYYGASTYAVDGSAASMKKEIMTNGPVEGAFTVYEDFVTYKSGVYKHTTGEELGGHAIRVLGWGNENGEDYWLVANSWNEDWGDKGTFKIALGECGIDDGMVAGKIKTTA